MAFSNREIGAQESELNAQAREPQAERETVAQAKRRALSRPEEQLQQHAPSQGARSGVSLTDGRGGKGVVVS